MLLSVAVRSDAMTWLWSKGIRSSDKRISCPGCGSMRASLPKAVLITVVNRKGKNIPLENSGEMLCRQCRSTWAWDDMGVYLLAQGGHPEIATSAEATAKSGKLPPRAPLRVPVERPRG